MMNSNSDIGLDFDEAPDQIELSQEYGFSPPFDLNTAPDQLPQFLKELNPSQLEAALTVKGPVMVLAGAGSGKTKMLTSRVGYLVGCCQVKPWQVLAVTFTNKAAAEMKERVERALASANEAGMGSGLGSPDIGTFHSVCVRILRREAASLPFTRPFVIYDDADQRTLIKSVMAQLNMDIKAVNPKSVQGAINRAKCDALEPDEIEIERYNAFDKVFKKVYAKYQEELIKNNALDFGEILCMTYRLLRDNKEIRKKYQRRYRFVHVDEYQDTNRVQYLLLNEIVDRSPHAEMNICVVGDEDQSIYGWRGADIRNIMDFERDYPGASVVKLEQNYRSTSNIIEASSELISNNTTRKDKRLWTDNEKGALIKRVYVADERIEAEWVISEIKALGRTENYSHDDYAIFYRTHAQSRQFEDFLRKEKIAYQVVGGLRFYDRKEIKDILAYFRVILNPRDSVSLKRIINTPVRGIGKTTLEKLDRLVAHEGEGEDHHWDTLTEINSGTISDFAARTQNKLNHFTKMMQNFMDQQPKLTLSDLYHLILDEIGYVREMRKENTPEALARIENLEEFDTIIQEFEEEELKFKTEAQIEELKPLLLARFVEQTSLVSQTDQKFEAASVKLMTLHAAKGLEFPVVFMVGLEEGLFPATRPWEHTPDEEIEEERRLCYVGMTRAKEKLYMLNASCRRIWGQFHYQDPARFFEEIPSEYLEHVKLSALAAGRSGPARQADPGEEEDSLEPRVVANPEESPEGIGRKIDHPDYGVGTIVSLEGYGSSQKVVVEFARRQRRKFLLRFVNKWLVEE